MRRQDRSSHSYLCADVTDLVWLISGAQARALEPALVAECALLSPSTGIVDSHAFMLALLGDTNSQCDDPQRLSRRHFQEPNYWGESSTRTTRPNLMAQLRRSIAKVKGNYSREPYPCGLPAHLAATCALPASTTAAAVILGSTQGQASSSAQDEPQSIRLATCLGALPHPGQLPLWYRPAFPGASSCRWRSPCRCRAPGAGRAPRQRELGSHPLLPTEHSCSARWCAAPWFAEGLAPALPIPSSCCSAQSRERACDRN